MQVSRGIVVFPRLSGIARLSCILLIFGMEEAFILASHEYEFVSILFVPGVLVCWFFPWKIAFLVDSMLLCVHIFLSSTFNAGPLYQVLLTGGVTESVLIASFGVFSSLWEKEHAVNVRMTRFIQGLNHNMRTPLTGAIGALGMIQEHSDKLSAVECMTFVEKALYSCEEVNALTTNIRYALQIEDDIPPPYCEPFLLDQAILGFLGYIYTFDHPLIDIKISEENVYVLADQLQVRQVLYNLISNALKFSAAKSPIFVHLGICRWNERYAYVCVKDHGVGIPPQQTKRLFQQFVRLIDHVDGTGLGLYTCYRMIREMGGSIWVESSGVPGEGSAFFFTLPLSEASKR